MISRMWTISFRRTFLQAAWKTPTQQNIFYLPATLTLSNRNLYLKTYDKEENVNTENSGIKKNYQSKLFGNNHSHRNREEEFYTENDPNTFGPRLTGGTNQQSFEDDDGDAIENEYLENPPNRKQALITKDYARLIKEHLNHNRIKEAIDVLEITMKTDRIQPEKYIYNLLISGCAKAGYSKKAFQLFNKMKQRNLQPSASTYTSLFNACANAPWALDGLNKANKLREIILQKGYEPNVPNYNVMIKAFGRCGDIRTAFSLADEMLEKKLQVNSSTFNFLLQACASDTEFGFRHALLTWHQMKSNRIVPDRYSFAIMLRCVRDCSIGDVNTVEELISKIISDSSKQKNSMQLHKQSSASPPVLTANSAENNELNEMLPTYNNNDDDTGGEIVEESTDQTPNLICDQPHLGSLISINEIIHAHDRFLLLGGFSGFLEEMKKAKITPGIEIFTTMLEVIPSTKASEKQLIAMIRKIGLKCDIDFFNILIKKRCMRYDYDGAKEVLTMIKTAKLQPDIVTYGVLALGCQTQIEARELLHEMHDKGIRMNIQILGAMLRQGTAQRNFEYVNEILEISLDENIKPNETFLKHLHNFNMQCTKLIENRHPVTKSKNFKHNLNNFEKKLKIWQEEHNIYGLHLQDAIKKITHRPYEQFKEKQGAGFENIKNEKYIRKQKVKKYIKRIKMKDLKDDTEQTSLSHQFLKQ